MAISEFSFSVDSFQNPKVVKDAEAVATLLVRLLLLEPGTIQSHPDMGVGLYSRYMHAEEGEASKLQSDFEKQIQQYLPQFQGVKVGVTEKDRTFRITAQIDSTVYGIYYDVNTATVQTGYTKLSDL